MKNYFYEGQLSLWDTEVQGELNLELPKRGNPNFKRLWQGATKTIRVPIAYAERLKSLCLQWQTGIQNSVTQIEKPSEGIAEIFPNEIALDPKRFQFKMLHNATGATGSLKTVKQWNPDLAGLLLVWLDPRDNLIYCVNGHNRLNLALKLGVSRIAVRFIAARDATEARLIGAMANIAEGNGSAIDAGKIFRESDIGKDDLKNYGVNLSAKLASDGLRLANLSDRLFDEIARGDLPINWGIAIGKMSDRSQQEKMSELLKKERRPITNEVLEELADIVISAENTATQELTLFGIETFSESLAIEKAQLQSYCIKRLKREKRLFATVANPKNAIELSRGNNRIDSANSQEIVNNTDNAIRLFNQLKNLSGIVSRKINEAAKELKQGNGQAKNTLYDWVIEHLTEYSLTQLIA